MLDIEKIRDHPKEVETKLKARGEDVDVEHILELDEERRRLITKVEDLRRERNENSERIGELKAEGKEAEAEDLIERMGRVSSKIDKLEEELTAVEAELEGELALLPNLPHDSVPISSDEDDKEVIAEYGEKPSFDYRPKNHMELG
ncbi:MAG: serine--tRNA ligase, partial [Candidatus Aenigmatarchaeota archaeon]